MNRSAPDAAALPWLIRLPTCPSTNSWALDRVATLEHGSCVWTGRQTAGRGRNGRRWESPTGVLTVSFVVDLSGSATAAQLGLAAGLAVAHTVEDLMPGAEVRIKWPNDCYASDRKLAGILCESAEPDARQAVVVGIGLNRDPQWDEDPAALLMASGRQRPIALSELGEAPDELALIVGLRRYLLEAIGVLSAGGWLRLLPGLRQRDWLRDRELQVASGGETIAGRGAGLDEAGRLLVRGADEPVRAIASGTVAVIASLR